MAIHLPAIPLPQTQKNAEYIPRQMKASSVKDIRKFQESGLDDMCDYSQWVHPPLISRKPTSFTNHDNGGGQLLWLERLQLHHVCGNRFFKIVCGRETALDRWITSMTALHPLCHQPCYFDEL